MGFDYEKRPSGYLRGIFSGDGRSRTAVQTSSRWAFYTLIPPLVFDRGLPEDGPAAAYPLET